MAASTGRTAAMRVPTERRLWAVHVGRGEIVWQDRCDAANGSKEPKLALTVPQNLFELLGKASALESGEVAFVIRRYQTTS